MIVSMEYHELSIMHHKWRLKKFGIKRNVWKAWPSFRKINPNQACKRPAVAWERSRYFWSKCMTIMVISSLYFLATPGGSWSISMSLKYCVEIPPGPPNAWRSKCVALFSSSGFLLFPSSRCFKSSWTWNSTFGNHCTYSSATSAKNSGMLAVKAFSTALHLPKIQTHHQNNLNSC